jgi:hypothetical protein
MVVADGDTVHEAGDVEGEREGGSTTWRTQKN